MTRKAKETFVRAHLNPSKCSPPRPRCCRWECRADLASRSIFCYSPSSDLALSKCSTAIATRIHQLSCHAVDVQLPVDGGKVSVK